MDRQFDQIPEIALDWYRAGHGVVLASVVQTWGSAPRPAGAMLAIRDDGQMMGSVSGGCVEAAVIVEALDALSIGAPRLLSYGVADEAAFAVGLACGGTIRILVEPITDGAGLTPDLLAQLVAKRQALEPCALVAQLQTGSCRLLGPKDDDPLTSSVAEALRVDKAMLEGDWFINIHNPPLRMFVIGAVHIAQPLLQMARLAGFAPYLIDPREAFGAASRFPGEKISHDWPDEALARAKLDARSVVITLTHDPKLDDPAIQAALASDCFYLGCLGSTRTHSKRLERLAALGVVASDTARIHAPVGLSIGAKSPAEIAIAIMAEVVACLRKPKPIG